MKTIKISILICINLCMLQFANAQVSGYGSGTLLSNPNWNSGLHYMDDVRAKVNSITTGCSGMTPGTATISISNKHGSFAVGDVALLIQMKGGTIGTHQNVVINAISGNDLCVDPVGSSLHSYSTTSGGKVQLIKINEYQNFTLSGSAVVTCHPWNDADGTGGILCMIVNGQLQINGGLFTVAAKGFTPEEAGVTFASGSAGGVPTASWSGTNLTTYAGAPTQQHICNDGWHYAPTNFTKGQDGTKAGTMGASKNLNTGTAVFYGGSTKNTLLVMGDPGYFKTNAGGAIGGQGGGYGGSGANGAAACNTTGSGGMQGNQGETGGNAGNGGKGGGAMVIKANTISITTNSVVFDASGGWGLPGDYGGDGGLGGIGGAGGAACCTGGTTSVPAGGNGGKGDVGKGGTVADAGDGGKPGYMWVAVQNSYSTTAANRNNNYRAGGGKGGKGGLGGWGDFNATFSRMWIDNPCDQSTFCGGGGSACYTYYCDLEKVMCRIKDATTVTHVGSNNYKFNQGLTNLVADYLSSAKQIIAYDNNSCGQASTYVTNTADHTTGDCDAIMSVYETISNLSNYNLTGICSSNSYPKLIEFDYPNTLLTFTKATPTSRAYIETGPTYIGTYKRCYLDPCYSYPGTGGAGYGPGGYDPYNGSPAPTRGNEGEDGDDAPDGNFDVETNPQDDDNNVILDDPANWIMRTQNILASTLKANVYPNPAKEYIVVEFTENSTVSVNFVLKDLAGKTIKQENGMNTGTSNKIKWSLTGVKPGTYVLEIKQGDNSYISKLTIK
jgi:hypothetical protein